MLGQQHFESLHFKHQVAFMFLLAAEVQVVPEALWESFASALKENNKNLIFLQSV